MNKKSPRGIPQSVKRPVAPPAYRPQPVPKILQTKSSSSHAGQAPRQRIAPKKIVQPKNILPLRKSPTAPPAYRPEQKRIAQPKIAMTEARLSPKSSLVHGPQPKLQRVQMKAQTVALPVSRSQSVWQKAVAKRIQLKSAVGVVQMTPCHIHKLENCQVCSLSGLLSGRVPGNQSLSRHIYSFLSNQDVGRLAATSRVVHGFASMDVERRHRRVLAEKRVVKEIRQGAFSCTYERRLGHNWADLHVTGKLGQSMSNSALVSILAELYQLMSVCHEETGVEGCLEWHPTGAVVTKQVVELLAVCLGGGFSLVKAYGLQRWRKLGGKSKERDKLAERIDEDILPEFFAFLDCLRGVPDITIIGVGLTRPPNYHLLTPPEKLKVKEQNMLETTPQGTERYSQYLQDYRNLEGICPSLKVLINYKLIPRLIKTIQSHDKG